MFSLGLLANWEYPRRKEKPIGTDRTGEYTSTAGNSTPIIKIIYGDGGGGYPTVYTVPAGKIFLLKGLTTDPTNGIIRAITNTNAGMIAGPGEEATFEPPIPYKAGSSFFMFNGPVGCFNKIYGVEETEEINRERNFL